MSICFSINQSVAYVTRNQLIDAARLAESQGYVTYTVADHCYTPMAPFPALAIAAESIGECPIGYYPPTDRIRFPS